MPKKKTKKKKFYTIDSGLICVVKWSFGTEYYVCYNQGIAGLDCWIAIYSVDWIVIDNPKSKSDFGFGMSIQLFHFNPNKKIRIFIKKLIMHLSPTRQATFSKFFKQLI